MVVIVDLAYTNATNGLQESVSNAGSLKDTRESQKALTSHGDSHQLSLLFLFISYPQILIPRLLILVSPCLGGHPFVWDTSKIVLWPLSTWSIGYSGISTHQMGGVHLLKHCPSLSSVVPLQLSFLYSCRNRDMFVKCCPKSLPTISKMPVSPIFFQVSLICTNFPSRASLPLPHLESGNGDHSSFFLHTFPTRSLTRKPQWVSSLHSVHLAWTWAIESLVL